MLIPAGKAALAPEHRALWVLIISGVLGFRVGVVGFPDWQVAVETAQVVAGIVTYPPDNPFSIYHAKLWTVLHQVSAVFLLAGLSEITLSIAISGLLGLVSFQALSLVVYALSRDALLAIGSAFLIFFTRAANETGVVYPIFLMGTTHTYGVIGLSTFVLVAGLLGAGCHRTAGFLLGLAPAVHPSLGAWLVLVVALGAVWHGRRFRDECRPALAYFLVGCGITAVSLAVQLAFVQDAPPIEGELAGKYLSAFVAFWDGHRRTIDLASAGVQLNAGGLALALIWLKWLASDLSRPAVFLLRLVAATAAVSLAIVLVSRVPPQSLPSALVILMPGRLLNFNTMVVPALLLGLVGAYRTRWWSSWLALFLSVGLLVSNRSMFWSQLEEHALARSILPVTRPMQILTYGVAGLLLFVGASAWHRSRQKAAAAPRAGARPAAIAAKIARALVLTLLVWIGASTWHVSTPRAAIFLDRTNNPVLSLAAQGDGMLLTGGDLHLVQLRTRRAVLLDGGGLDGLPYALEAGPAVERILREVYAIDYFNPPEEARGTGTIPSGPNQAAWERFSRERWQQIRRAYGVTQVLTYAHWNLELPVVARDASHVLYQLP